MSRFLIELSQIIDPSLTVKEAELYNHFREHRRVPSSEEWGEKASAYSQLKKRIKEKLVDGLFLEKFDLEKVEVAHVECYKKYAAAQILRGTGKANAGIELGEEVLKKACRYHFTEIGYNVCNFLQLRYAVAGMSKDHLRVTTQATQFLDWLNKEYESQNIYTKLILNFSKARGVNVELTQEIGKIVEKIESLRCSNHTWLIYFSVRIIEQQLKGDNEKLIQVCEEAIEYFKTRPYYYPSKFSFRFKKIAPYIQIGQYDNAVAIIEECLDIAPITTYNYNVTLMYQAILGFHAQRYELVLDAIDQSKSKYIFDNAREQWQIIDAYVAFLQKVGRMPSKRRFRIGTFLNGIEIYHSDKAGNNINLIVLQILHYLVAKNYDAITDREEALTKYSNRYLNGPSTKRSKYFLKALAKLPASNFHPIAWQRKAGPFWKELQALPLATARQSAEIEIVPYEQLWECILTLLKR